MKAVKMRRKKRARKVDRINRSGLRNRSIYLSRSVIRRKIVWKKIFWGTIRITIMG